MTEATTEATNDVKFTVFKLIGMILLYLFLPLNALTYLFFRLHRRKFEVDRILDVLHLEPKDELAYKKA
jgi:hypothetical protein